MKKIIGLLLTIIFLMSSALAESEITFLNIPWLVDAEGAISILNDAGYIRASSSVPALSNEYYVFPCADETDFAWPVLSRKYQDICFSMSLAECIKGKIAGYPIKNVVLSFAYDGEFKLISVKLELIGAEYNVIKEKLSIVYGNEQYSKNEEGIESYLWKGSDDTCVFVYTENKGDNYDLIYGRLDSIDILSRCLDFDMEDVSGL